MENVPPPRSALDAFLLRRIPARDEIKAVFAVAAFCVFSWELRNYFYQFPALILSYNLWDLLSIAAYALAFALVESILTLAFFVALAFILPGFAMRDGFSYKASFAIVSASAVAIYLQAVMSNQPTTQFLLLQLARFGVLWLVPTLLTRYVPFVRKFVLDVLDRLTVFNYIYPPLGILSLLVVILRNLW